METTKPKAPFAWVGKSKLASKIIPLTPPYIKYIEVLYGALSVFYQKEEIINDKRRSNKFTPHYWD